MIAPPSRVPVFFMSATELQHKAVDVWGGLGAGGGGRGGARPTGELYTAACWLFLSPVYLCPGGSLPAMRRCKCRVGSA